jgi:putative transposase
MFDFKQLFETFKRLSSPKFYKDVFDHLKKHLIDRTIEMLDQRKKSKCGRKRTIDLDNFYDCLFFIADNGMKTYYITDHFGITKSTYYYYFDLISKSGLVELIYSEIVMEYTALGINDYLVTDTFTVKSMDGSDGLGRNPTDRGRKGLKVSLICDQNLITHAVDLEPANIHDSKILEKTIDQSITNLSGHICLADSGYAGQKYISTIKEKTGLILISKPKKTRSSSKMSHQISDEDLKLLNKKRNLIERLNGNIRNFRGLMIKYTKKISSYRTYLYIALLCITCYQLFIHHS